MELCGPRHKTAGQYPVAQITNGHGVFTWAPLLSPGVRVQCPSNGSQVHEFAPPGPPPRRGIRARPGPGPPAPRPAEPRAGRSRRSAPATVPTHGRRRAAPADPPRHRSARSPARTARSAAGKARGRGVPGARPASAKAATTRPRPSARQPRPRRPRARPAPRGRHRRPRRAAPRRPRPRRPRPPRGGAVEGAASTPLPRRREGGDCKAAPAKAALRRPRPARCEGCAPRRRRPRRRAPAKAAHPRRLRPAKAAPAKARPRRPRCEGRPPRRRRRAVPHRRRRDAAAAAARADRRAAATGATRSSPGRARCRRRGPATGSAPAPPTLVAEVAERSRDASSARRPCRSAVVRRCTWPPPSSALGRQRLHQRATRTADGQRTLSHSVSVAEQLGIRRPARRRDHRTDAAERLEELAVSRNRARRRAGAAAQTQAQADGRSAAAAEAARPKAVLPVAGARLTSTFGMRWGDAARRHRPGRADADARVRGDGRHRAGGRSGQRLRPRRLHPARERRRHRLRPHGADPGDRRPGRPGRRHDRAAGQPRSVHRAAPALRGARRRDRWAPRSTRCRGCAQRGVAI